LSEQREACRSNARACGSSSRLAPRQLEACPRDRRAWRPRGKASVTRLQALAGAAEASGVVRGAFDRGRRASEPDPEGLAAIQQAPFPSDKPRAPREPREPARKLVARPLLSPFFARGACAAPMQRCRPAPHLAPLSVAVRIACVLCLYRGMDRRVQGRGRRGRVR
jgi:hypothetical protein